MGKILFTISFMLIRLVLPAQQNYSSKICGHWEGGIEKNDAIQLIKFDLFEEAGKLKGTYTIPAQNIYEAVLVIDSLKMPSFTVNFDYGIFNVNYWESADEITGSCTEPGKNSTILKLHLRKIGTKDTKHFTEEEVLFKNGNVQLAGTFLKPKLNEKFPVVILVHGSGPNDRKTSDYYSQAYNLANNGIGVLIYDKRGTGNSTGDWEKSSMFELAADANAGFQYIKARKDIRTSKIGMMGTSQGGWILPIAANLNKNVSFLVLNVGPAVSVYQQYDDFLHYFMKDKGVPSASIDSLVRFTNLFFRSLNDSSLRKEVIELAKHIESNGKWWGNFLPAYDSANIIWWKVNKYDPQVDLSKIKCPVLSIMGTSDEFVPAQENEALMQKYLSQSGTPFRIKVFENMEHSSEITDQWIKNESGGKHWVWRRTIPGFYETIIDWIKKVANK
jgi:dienelactone hydrolase